MLKRTDTKLAVEIGTLIVAAGRSLRMGGQDKVMVPILGRPLISHTLKTFSQIPQIGRIVLMVSDKNLDSCTNLVLDEGLEGLVKVKIGGAKRQDSVRLGLDEMPDPGATIVHDGARPCVDSSTIARAINAVHRHGAAIAAVPATDTIKVISRDRRVASTIERDGLWASQTPQIFNTRLLKECHSTFCGTATDDAAMVEANGNVVNVFLGSYDNIKVTTPEDIDIAETILTRRSYSGGRNH